VRFLVVVMLLAGAAQAAGQETRVQSDLRREMTEVKESCGGGIDPKNVAGCAYTLATDDPLHVAFGSLAPQNGTAFGVAFVEHSTPNERWRIGWNADAVAASGGSYRGGLYMKLVPTPTSTGGGIIVRRPNDPAAPAPPSPVTIREYPVLNGYVQTISLDTVPLVAHGSVFKERQTIVGTDVVYPLSRFTAIQPLRMSVVGALNGRWVNTSSSGDALRQHASFAQFEEGVRFRPALLGDRLQLNYLASLQQFMTSETSAGSFHRWTIDLQHTIPLYQTATSTGPKATNGPDDCGQAVGVRCPPLSLSRNREGAIGVRVLASRSVANGGSSVPFYYQPTLGGADLNGQRLLSGYDDYRFRGTNLFMLQESIEHSIWGPIGVYALVEQGTVTPEGADLTVKNLAHSFGIGLTVRAGGFPLINLTVAWGGGGHHIIGTIDPTLLGGSSRPPLF
jgi:hypothetical protein